MLQRPAGSNRAFRRLQPHNRQPTDSFAVQDAPIMTTRLKTLAIGGLAALVAGLPFAAVADQDGDHDRARELYERGEIHALDDIMRTVGERVLGDIVAVDLIQLGDKWIYRFQIVATDGHRMTVDVDAGAGAFIRSGTGGP